MKQGGSTIDTNVLATGRGLSSGSPSVAPVWTSPSTVKTPVGTTGSYIPSYTSWYPTTHQESMQQSQLMWTGAFSADISGEVVKAPPFAAAQRGSASMMRHNNLGDCRRRIPPDEASEEQRAEHAANPGATKRGAAEIKRTKGAFLGGRWFLSCLFFLLVSLCEHICQWSCMFMFVYHKVTRHKKT